MRRKADASECVGFLKQLLGDACEAVFASFCDERRIRLALHVELDQRQLLAGDSVPLGNMRRLGLDEKGSQEQLQKIKARMALRLAELKEAERTTMTEKELQEKARTTLAAALDAKANHDGSLPDGLLLRAQLAIDVLRLPPGRANGFSG